ncbi:hypothetical protein J6590_046736 [Homalodisca vitripennis]|nr:hypothetical protein J6590_046736 [Homalodisca vitripennis]
MRHTMDAESPSHGGVVLIKCTLFRTGFVCESGSEGTVRRGKVRSADDNKQMALEQQLRAGASLSVANLMSINCLP